MFQFTVALFRLEIFQLDNGTGIYSWVPLRHLMTKLDGPTSGPTPFHGPFGKALPTCHLLPTVVFEPIPVGDLPPVTNFNDLSTDQLYFWRVLKAVDEGYCPPDLAEIMPGPINHARWLTLASRTLRLYMATECPTAELEDLVKYIVRVYGITWFRIKMYHSCTDGVRHIFQMISLRSHPRPELRAIVRNVIQSNAFFAHWEHVLLAMLTDKRVEVREQAVQHILNARKQLESSRGKF